MYHDVIVQCLKVKQGAVFNTVIKFRGPTKGGEYPYHLLNNKPASEI